MTCCKIEIDNPRSIMYTNFIELENSMFNAKFEDQRISAFEKDFKGI